LGVTTKGPTHRPDQPFDLGAGLGEGSLWGVASEDMNATLSKDPDRRR
jgi:hypothetical protein